MRVIGYIEHPTLKISIFRMDQRMSIKFENSQYEQTYKLGEDDRFATVEAVQQLVDPAMLEQVLSIFRQMHQTKMAAINRFEPEQAEEVFETII